MTKKLNEAAIVNELKGQSAFFRSAPPPPAEPVISHQSTPLPQPEKSPVSPAVVPVERLEEQPPTVTSLPKNQEPSPSASMQASNQASELASYHASIVETIRKTVKGVGKEVMFVRLTQQEKEQLADIAYTFKRQGQKTSENEISRIAINFLLEDYKANGEQSILAQVLARLLA